MANYEDLLKKGSKRLKSIKKDSKRIERRGPTRPWQENINDKVDKSSEAEFSSSSHENPRGEEKNLDIQKPKMRNKNQSERKSEAQLKRKQNDNSTETNVYVNKSDNVNKAVTDRKQFIPINHKITDLNEDKRKQNENNTETNVYVNKSDNVNKAVTDSGPDKQFEDNKSSCALNSNINKDADNSPRFVYVNSSQTERKQNENTITNSSDYVSNTIASSQTSTETERKQNEIYKLSRLETNIFNFIIQTCIANGGKKTPPISYKQVSENVGSTVGSCKTLVARLIKKGFLVRVDFTKGPGSRTIYQVPNDSYQAFLIKNHSFLNFEMRKQNENNTKTIQETSSQTTLPSSSSSNNISTTRERNPWEEINIPNVMRNHGFTITHAKQVLSDKANNLSVEEIQESFDNFALDLEKGVLNIKSSPIHFLMAVLRRNRVLYESVYAAEQTQLEIEEYLKRHRKGEEVQKQKAELELAEKYRDWLTKLSIEERNRIAPPSEFVAEGSHSQDRLLKAHFNKLAGLDE